MSQPGSGTTTDNTNTSNEIHFVGDSFEEGYALKDQQGKVPLPNDDPTNLTGYTPRATAVLVKTTTSGDFSSITPVGSCVVNSATTSTIEADCPTGTGVWTKNPSFSLPVTETDLANGQFSVYFQRNLLRKLGLVAGQEPKLGEPAYVLYTVSVCQTDGNKPTKYAVSEDVKAFQGTTSYEIAVLWVAGVHPVGELVYSPSDDNDYVCIVATDGTDVTDPSTDTANWTIKY